MQPLPQLRKSGLAYRWVDRGALEPATISQIDIAIGTREQPTGISRAVTITAGGTSRGLVITLQMCSAGVLKFKRQAEELLQRSGIPWVLLRPGRLTDGPYTSYDLNTLLQATSGQRQDVQVPPPSPPFPSFRTYCAQAYGRLVLTSMASRRRRLRSLPCRTLHALGEDV